MNIINGDSAAGCFKNAFNTPADEILVFRDVLSCGPIQAYSGTDDWIRHREKYWHEILIDCALEPYSFRGLPRDFFENIDELKGVNNVSLWIGSGLSDQLLLTFIVFLFDYYQLNFNKLSIYQYYKLDNLNYEIHGVGLLHPDNIKRNRDPVKLTDHMIKTCLNAWSAFLSNAPESLLELLRHKRDQLPLLFRSMSRLIYRFPNIFNGLSYWDEKLLSNISIKRQKAARIIGNSMSHDIKEGEENTDQVGDLYLFSRLKDFARSIEPLIEISSLEYQMRFTELNILKFGLDVKENRKNAVSVNGINDWVGGIHLDSSTGEAWFRDGNELIQNTLN